MENVFKQISKYNPWNGNDIPIGFKRSFYLNKIEKYIGNSLIKVIIGQRRIGKSYILRQIIHHLISDKGINSDNIFYLNKEFTIFDQIASSSDLEELFLYYKEKMKVAGKIYIFLDEVQNIIDWEKFVNSYSQDFSSPYELFISGSNSKLLSGNLATLLSGRYIQFEIQTFSFTEYTDFYQIEANQNSFSKYIQTGALPELFHLQEDEIRRNYIEGLKNTIVLRDIIQRYQIKDSKLLEDIFKFLLTNIGNLTSIPAIVRYFKNQQRKTNYDTLALYIDYLCDTFVLHKVERYDIRGKQSLGGEKKYYINDLSFKNYLYGFYPSDIGYHLENFVYLHLRRNGFQINIGKINSKEIDFIATKADKTIYIQVSYLLNSPQVIDREFGNLQLIRDNHEKIVISMDDFKFSNKNGLKHLRPWEFLSNSI